MLVNILFQVFRDNIFDGDDFLKFYFPHWLCYNFGEMQKLSELSIVVWTYLSHIWLDTRAIDDLNSENN